jgi:ketosteroid isomerase-like protein
MLTNARERPQGASARGSSRSGPACGFGILFFVLTDVERARVAYKAFGRGRVESLSEWFDPEIEWIEPPELPGARSYRGRDRVQRYLASIFELWDEFVVEPESFEDVAGDLLIGIHIRARARASGATVEDHVVHRVTIRNGKATRIAVYQRREDARRT